MARKTTEKPAEAAAPPHFDAVLAADGHVVPADRRHGLMAIYEDMRKQVAIVGKETLNADAEPSNIFSLVPYTRRADEA
jgi:hypothetical protein